MTAISLPSRKLILLSGSLIPSWLPLAGGTVPTLFADFTTEGAGNHYWFNGAQYQGFAAWNTAIGGTFSRASSATYLQGGVVKSALSGAVRFPSDINSAPTGVRLTGAGTNVHLQSQQFGAAWTALAATLTAAAATAPDGTSTAATFVPTATTGSHATFLSAGVTRSASGTDVFSLFVKAAGYNFIFVDPENNGTNFSYFGITGSGSVVSNSGTGVGSITALANGWYRVSVAYTATGAANIDPIFYASINGTTHASITTDGTSGYQIWGFQYEKGVSFATDYIPTTTGTVAQAADSLSFPFTQTTFSVLAKTINQQTVASGRVVGLSTGDTPIFVSTLTKFSLFSNPNVLSGPVLGSDIMSSHKTMAAGGATSSAIESDGLAVSSTGNAFTSGTPTVMYIGSNSAASNWTYGDISQLAVWNNLVASNSDLQRLTT